MKRWHTVEADEARTRDLAATLSLPAPLARVLVARGLTESGAIDRFLNPRLSELGDPGALPDMDRAVARLRRALETDEDIVIFGDYDVDGLTSTALLTRVLRELGAKPTPFLPHRVEEGYGLSIEALTRCLDAHRPGLVITVDCGTGSAAAVEKARAAGTDVIVTDHHEPSGPVADACAVVNPRLGRDGEPEPLAGVGVTFKLCHALIRHARELGHAPARDLDLRRYLDLAAVGTIADIVPLLGENRVLARKGLEQLARTEWTGLAALKETAGLDGPPSAYHVGFVLGPRLNAAGRLGDAALALELLLTDAAGRAREIALRLDRTNRQRRRVEKETLDQAIRQLDESFDPAAVFGIVAAGEGWHPGVLGIVASRLVERFWRPVVVIGADAEGRMRGSCRSIPEVNMVEVLGGCADLLLKYGGHAMAAGLEVRPGALDEFKVRFNEAVAERARELDPRPVQRVDAWLELHEADDHLLDASQAFQPFGHANPTPVWATRGVQVVGPPRVVGRDHLKMRVAMGSAERECIGFGLGARALPEGPIDLAFQLKRNTFRGRTTLQLQVRDFRPAAG